MSSRPAILRRRAARAVGALRQTLAQEATRGDRETSALRAGASAVFAAGLPGAGTISDSAQFTTRRRASPSTPARRWAPVASHLVSATGASHCGEETRAAVVRCLNGDSRAGLECGSARTRAPPYLSAGWGFFFQVENRNCKRRICAARATAQNRDARVQSAILHA